MKVFPENIDLYISVEKIWKKIHQYNIKEGKYQFWTIQEVLSPVGTLYDYNYIARISFENAKQYSNFIEGDFVPSNLSEILTKEEMIIYNNTEKSRSLVKTEVWQLMSEMDDADQNDEDWRYSKFNYFSINDGYTPDDFVAVQSIWSPIHEARIKDDKLEGWVVLRKLLPEGTLYKEKYATVDHYKNMGDLLTDDPSRYFDMLGDAEEAFKKTEEGANLIRQEVRRIVLDSN
ncbi:hypothetical protein GCM10007940_43300 [Portibacter lacus]|uniref:Uncharacterized protein n=2 Tax=Portibacter lacus TaxID=1099794 RepID=A0AA37SU23_9BACT|nr:hypothetical protein GCM10007940_43300 [Portibacter lacus]